MKNSPKFVWVLVFILFTALISAGCSGPATDFPSAGITPTVPAEAPAVAPSPTALQALVATETPEQAETLSMDTAGALRFEIVQPESKARYRVREQLVNLDLPNDAVGETDLLTGVIVLNPDGTIDSVASKIEVDLTTLVSDESRRDGYVRRNVLQTDQYPKPFLSRLARQGWLSPCPSLARWISSSPAT